MNDITIKKAEGGYLIQEDIKRGNHDWDEKYTIATSKEDLLEKLAKLL